MVGPEGPTVCSQRLQPSAGSRKRPPVVWQFFQSFFNLKYHKWYRIPPIFDMVALRPGSQSQVILVRIKKKIKHAYQKRYINMKQLNNRPINTYNMYMINFCLANIIPRELTLDYNFTWNSTLIITYLYWVRYEQKES